MVFIKIPKPGGYSLSQSGPRWAAVLLVLSLTLLLGACAVAESGAPAETKPDAAESADFTADDALTGGGDIAGASIANVRFGQHEGFERLVIDFEDAGTLPQWRLDMAAAEGVLRIHLPNVKATAFTDGELAGALLSNVYVVRNLDGSLFVDVFTPASFKYRVEELGDPVRLVIDVAAEGTDTNSLPVTSKSTVLISPRPWPTLKGTLAVSGYSRNFEANNVIILQDGEGNELARAIATSTDYIETWGFFSTELSIPDRTGTGVLLVGDFDAQSGSFTGVTIPVKFGDE